MLKSTLGQFWSRFKQQQKKKRILSKNVRTETDEYTKRKRPAHFLKFLKAFVKTTVLLS